MNKPVSREDLGAFMDQLLAVDRFVDYGPNGLQVEGRETIEKVAFAVSATAHSVAAARDLGAGALVAHHGLLWNFQGPKPLVGPFARRVFPLVKGGINLYAYHLPLDAHPVIGNAARLAYLLGVEQWFPFGDYKGSPTGVWGFFSAPATPLMLQDQLKVILNHEVIMATPDPDRPLQRIGIITGGANSEWKRAADSGLDAFLTGEMSEHDWHESQEAGVTMLAGGHHATEQFGIKALMAAVSEQFAVECVYIPSDNPA